MFFYAGQLAKLGFNPHTSGMGVFHHLLGQGDVFFIRQGGTVNHDGREAAVNAVTAHFKGRTVIQMHADGHFRRFGQGGFHKLHDVGLAGVFAGTGGNLQDAGRFFL